MTSPTLAQQSLEEQIREPGANPITCLWSAFVERMGERPPDVSAWCGGVGCTLVLVGWWLQHREEVDGEMVATLLRSLDAFIDDVQ